MKPGKKKRANPLQDRAKCSKVKKKKTSSLKLWPLSFCAVIFLLGIVTISYVNIYALDQKLQQRQEELAKLETEQLNLVGEIHGIRSSVEIAREARYKLGMVYPETEQIVYIDVRDDREDQRVEDNVFLSPVISVLKTMK